MAEVLVALGGVAAATQLIHYGHRFFIAASALSHEIRHSSEKIEDWARQLEVMVLFLDDVQQTVCDVSPGIVGLLKQCREDTVKLQTLLTPFCTTKSRSTPSKMTRRTFVFRKEVEIERLVASFRSAFNSIANYFTMRLIIQMKPNPTPNNAAIIGMAGSNRSNLSLHRFLPESVTQNLLTILSLLHTSGISTTLLLGLFDAESLSTAVSTLISQSYVQQDLAKRSVSIDPLAQQTVLSEIMASSDRSRYFALATRSLNSIFNAEFARPRTLHRSHRLYLHVSTILNTTMDLPLDLSAFEEATTLAIRYCMYLITVGHYSQALKLIAAFREWCKAQLPSDFDVETALSGKEAAAQASSGSLNTALCLLRYIYRSRLRTFGPTDIDTLHSINGLGLVHHALGNVQKAFRYHSKALVAKTRFLGANDPDTLVSANNLGLVLQSKGDYQAAEKLFSRTLKGWLQAYDPDDLFVITARSNIGIALHFQGKLDEAENIHRYVYNERLRILGNTHHETVKSKANLAITVNEKGYPSQAEQLYREALAAFQTELGQSHPDTLKTHTNLATALHDQGKFQEAESVVKLALPLIGAKYGSSHAETIEAMAFRAILLQHLGKFTKAHGIATEVYEARREKLGYDHDDTQRSLQHVRDLAEDCEEAHVLQTFSTSISIAAA